MGTPRASRTSAEPQREVTARLPCLATLAPAAAATSAAPVEILKVERPTAAGAARIDKLVALFCVRGTGMDARRMTSTKPASSGACSPRVAITVSSAAISTSGTSPARKSAERFGGLFAGESRAVFGERLEEVFQRGHISLYGNGALCAEAASTQRGRGLRRASAAHDSIWIPLARSRWPGIT